MKRFAFLSIMTIVLGSNAFASDACLSNGGSIENAIVSGVKMVRLCVFKETVENVSMNSVIGYNDVLMNASGASSLSVKAYLSGAAGTHAGTDLGKSICSRVNAELVQVIYTRFPNAEATNFCRFKDDSIIEALTLIGKSEYKKLDKALSN